MADDEANALLAELLVRYARVASPDPHKSSLAVAAAHMRDAVAARPLAETAVGLSDEWCHWLALFRLFLI